MTETMKINGELAFGYQKHTIEISEGKESITLSGCTTKQGFIYVYLYSPSKVLHAAFIMQKNSKSIAFSATESTAGGLAGVIEAGEWSLHLYNLEGEFRSSREAMPYELEIETDKPFSAFPLATFANLSHEQTIIFEKDFCLNENAKWYRGDLHAHTIISDGHNSLEEAVEIIEQQQLDFIFLTEHNLCLPYLPASNKTLFLPSIEVTTDKGHFNIHAPTKPLNMFQADFLSEALIQSGLTLADENSILSINHPCINPWSFEYDEMLLADIDVIEIINDPTYKNSMLAAEESLKWFTEIWNAGHKIYAVGGSDCHLKPSERNALATLPSIYGDPSTFIFAESLSLNAILNGMRNGHIYFERFSQLIFSIKNQDGETILPGQGITDSIIVFSLSAQSQDSTYTAQIIADGTIISTHRLSRVAQSLSINMENRAWIRVDIRNEEGALEGMINPIYNQHLFNHNNSNAKTWGDIRKLVEQNNINKETDNK